MSLFTSTVTKVIVALLPVPKVQKTRPKSRQPGTTPTKRTRRSDKNEFLLAKTMGFTNLPSQLLVSKTAIQNT
jgi:hypothetical protein